MILLLCINNYIRGHFPVSNPMLQLPNLDCISVSRPARQAITQRFSKYKKAQPQHNTNAQDQIQGIFQKLAYTPLFPNSKQRSSVGSTRSSLSARGDHDGSDEQASIEYELDMTVSDVDLSMQSSRTNTSSCEDVEKPAFIRTFSKLNSVTPNTSHPKFSLENQVKKLSQLIKQALKALRYVMDSAIKVSRRNKRIRLFSTANKHKFTLDYFLNSGWQRNRSSIFLKPLKPLGNFTSNFDSIQKVIGELDRQMAKTVRYQLAINLTQNIGLELYCRIRENLLEVEQKVIECAGSVYLLGSMDQYPDYYYEYLKILTSREQLDQETVQQASQQFCQRWEAEEPLTCSEVGRAVWDRLTGSY